ncbi:flagellar hook-length control protein FliK [Bacillus sp. FJAT-28004]|uniref:flagellar hook-length control protein FliK n=1 Tax=Bacillus sp. FJAT-28004 TaxID=1679165 RepID=UPI0006B5E393|nr:flagellar hook-length control protein FliK [Bacillus sp. FJAT-28004]
MEMNISQVAVAQPQAQAAQAGQASNSTNGAAFQKTLVQQMNGEAANNSSQAPGTPLVANVSKEAPNGVDGAAVAPTLSELMSIIDGLIEQLDTTNGEEGKTPLEDNEQLQQLEAVLDQMNALLALLGIPVPVIQQSISQLTGEEGSPSTPLEVQNAVNMKSNLQDTLLQLQVMLQQGTTKLIGQQEPTVLVAQQLQALTAILEGEPVDTTKTHTKSTAFTQQLFTAQNAQQADVSTFLQRLSQQTAHPALLATAVQGMEQAIATEASDSTIELIPQMQLGTNNSDVMRTFTSLVANAGAATSFVVADEFAKSMTGMIVQKFDLTTMNGVSEAKLMLFPEHLGQVDVRITMQNGLLTAIFQTDTAMAKDMLDNQMAQLRSALQAQGLMVDKLEVSQGQSAAQLFQQQHGQGSNQQQASNRHMNNGEDSVSEAQFETEMIEQASIQGLGFGRGINVKA